MDHVVGTKDFVCGIIRAVQGTAVQPGIFIRPKGYGRCIKMMDSDRIIGFDIGSGPFVTKPSIAVDLRFPMSDQYNLHNLRFRIFFAGGRLIKRYRLIFIFPVPGSN